MAHPSELMSGDRIEIRYRAAAQGDELRDKWIAAVVTSVHGGVWPLVRLADGQLTEVRRFMEWRYSSAHMGKPRPRHRSA